MAQPVGRMSRCDPRTKSQLGRPRTLSNLLITKLGGRATTNGKARVDRLLSLMSMASLDANVGRPALHPYAGWQ
jgi:hypothetical protein